MTLSRRTTSLSSGGAISYDWLDPASAWVQDEYAIIPPIESEPYDWTLEDDAVLSPLLIPIAPPILDGSGKLRQAKRKANLSEAAILIPIEKRASGQLVRRNKTHLACAPPAFARQTPTSELVRRTRTRPRRKHLISSVLLLLLSAIALFIFAYIAQKYGG